MAGRYLKCKNVSAWVKLVRAASTRVLGRTQQLRDTNGFRGSPIVFSQSSILLVCSLIASKGLGSFVASALPGPANWLLRPRL
jgi:hypothetical protein